MATRVLGVLAGAAAVGVGAVAVRKHKGKGSSSDKQKDSADANATHHTNSEKTVNMHALPTSTATANSSKKQAADPVASVLKGNEQLFSGKELELIKMLLEEDQGQLFAAWPPLGERDADKQRMVQQIVQLDGSYHGGLRQYITNARQLLADSKEGRNVFDGFVPSNPEGKRLDFGSPDFLQLEGAGMAAVAGAAFVLVAGGLGERLGYKGIKVALPSESASGRCFLQLYIETILALQDASGASARGVKLPLAIMTSDDTHARTQDLLAQHNYFGMQPDQVYVCVQQ